MLEHSSPSGSDSREHVISSNFKNMVMQVTKKFTAKSHFPGKELLFIFSISTKLTWNLS